MNRHYLCHTELQFINKVTNNTCTCVGNGTDIIIAEPHHYYRYVHLTESRSYTPFLFQIFPTQAKISANKIKEYGKDITG